MKRATFRNSLTIFLVLLLSGASVAIAALTFNATTLSSDGALTLTGAATSTWDIGAGRLSIQTTNNGAITTGSGLLTVGGILDVTNIDRSGTIAIGTSSATGVTIGRTTVNVTFPGSLSVTGTSTFTATSTFNGILDSINIDRSGTIAIGTSSATTITIGRSGQNVVFPGNASTTGTFTVGGGGAPIVRHLSATSSITFGVIASTTCSIATASVTNATSGDAVVATPLPVASGIDTVSSTWSAWVSASNTVTVRACNPTFSNTASVAAQTWRFDVWQH